MTAVSMRHTKKGTEGGDHLKSYVHIKSELNAKADLHT